MWILALTTLEKIISSLGGVETTTTTTSSDPWTVTVCTNGTPLELHIGMGAEATVVPEQEPWSHQTTLSGDPVFTNYLHSRARKFSTEKSQEELAAVEVMYVVRGLHKPFLGCPAIYRDVS